MNSRPIYGGHFGRISGVYKQNPAPRLKTMCRTGASSIGQSDKPSDLRGSLRHDITALMS